MEQTEVKFGEWIQEGFNLYKENFGLLVLVSLIAGILSSVTLGILSGPMLAGVFGVTLALYDKSLPKPEVKDVFKGFDYFLQTFLFCIVWGGITFITCAIVSIVPCLGQIAVLAISWAIQTFLMFGLFLIVDQNYDFWPASMESFEKVKTALWPFMALIIVSSIIGSIGALACGIGAAVTMPVHFCILTVAYREVYGTPATAVVVEND